MLDLEVLEQYGECEKIGEPITLEKKSEALKSEPATSGSNGFYSNAPDTKPPQQLPISRPSASNPSSGAHANIYPIEALSPYAHKWTIKVRCTNKSEIKTWHNKNGEGKLFSVNLLDDSGEIRGTGFKEQCDALYDVFQEGGVYYISNPCRVQLAKKQFTNLNNDYELTFESGTIVEKVHQVSVEFYVIFLLITYFTGGRTRWCSSSTLQFHQHRGSSERGERYNYRYYRDSERSIGNKPDYLENHE